MGQLKEEEFDTVVQKDMEMISTVFFFFLTDLFVLKQQPHGVQDPSLLVSDFVCVRRSRFFCALAGTGCSPESVMWVHSVLCVCCLHS